MATNKQRLGYGIEVNYDSSGGTSSYQAFSGDFDNPARVIIFDNQSSVAVAISIDAVNTWKTFAAGQAIILDVASDKSDMAGDLAAVAGTLFYASSAAGTGLFLITYCYAQ